MENRILNMIEKYIAHTHEEIENCRNSPFTTASDIAKAYGRLEIVSMIYNDVKKEIENGETH